jgi:HlyD family secretion protein
MFQALGIRPLFVIVALAVVLIVLIVLRSVTKKRIFGTLAVLLVLAAVASIFIIPLFVQPPEDPLANGEVYAVVRGDIAEVVEATGNLAPVSQVDVTFSIAGTLDEVRVKTGDKVTEGQILAVLDTTDLELQLAQSEAAVRVAEANLEKVLTGARAEDITVTENSVYQAYTNVQQQEVTLSAATERARLAWVQSANSLRDAQQAYENIYWDNRKLEDKIGAENVPDINYDNEEKARRAVENAEAAMEQARLSYESAKEQQDATLRTARSQVSTAQANLEKLTAGPQPTDINAAQAQVEQSRASLAVTQNQLEKATLRAPFSGIVAKVLIDAPNPVSQATAILVLMDPTAYQVDVEVDEVDISRVEVGQRVRITLDAVQGISLTARVQEIALTPSAAGGVVTYRVRVQLGAVEEAAVRAGMTANVQVVTNEARNVLIVPRRAVRLVEDQAYVERVVAGTTLETITVTMGLSDPQYVEITSGLQEDDQVFVRGVVQENQLQQMFGNFGPGGARSGGVVSP